MLRSSPLAQSSVAGVHRGLENLIDQYLEMRRGESLLVATDATLRDLIDPLGPISRARGVDLATWMITPTTVFEPARVLAVDAVLFLQRHKSFFASEIKQLLASEPGRWRFHRLFGSSPHTLAQSFNVPKSELEALNNGVLNALASASRVQVTSAAGTDLSFSVAAGATWMSNFGSTQGNLPATLPPGEVSSYSTTVTGRLVADGSLNANFNSVLDFDARLGRNPVTLELEDSRVASCSCEYDPIETMLQNFLANDNADRVGEIGFGTNVGIDRFTELPCLANERWPGFHLGLGEHNQPSSRVLWDCPVHLDLIVAAPVIRADDRVIFEDGRWVKSALLPAPARGRVEIGLSDIV
jgi:hypothetical protein